MVAESASYTRMREADRHAEKRARALAEGSMSARRWREKRGRFRRVEGTESETARGTRVVE